jgi:hypothetical protein
VGLPAPSITVVLEVRWSIRADLPLSVIVPAPWSMATTVPWKGIFLAFAGAVAAWAKSGETFRKSRLTMVNQNDG